MTRHERRRKWRKAWKGETNPAGSIWNRADRRAAAQAQQKKITAVRMVLRAHEQHAAKKAARDAKRERQARERA